MTIVRSDAIVVGAGIAGLMAALKLAPDAGHGAVQDAGLGRGAATDWAQGGIAAAMGADDSPSLHAHRHAARRRRHQRRAHRRRFSPATRRRASKNCSSSAPRSTATRSGELALGREAAHQRRRIVKAGGDATGHEILKTLIAAVRESPVDRGRRGRHRRRYHRATTGALRASTRTTTRRRRMHAYLADAVVLATGGIGRLYRYTTNPVEATGDGIAMAARAGAMLADMEFVQFHPTALAIGRDPMPLVTEAVRGEGAILVNDLGERFMLAIHPDAELAPRDVVARAIFEQLQRGRTVGLDARAAIGEAFPTEFPTVFGFCRDAGIDPRAQRIPVAPAAHYYMGGIAVDEWGRSSLAGLWACGEASATGVHGANRLASNSLLEALVYGSRVAENIAATRTEDVQPHDASLRGASSRRASAMTAAKRKRSATCAT